MGLLEGKRNECSLSMDALERGTHTRDDALDGSCLTQHYSNGENAKYYVFTLEQAVFVDSRLYVDGLPLTESLTMTLSQLERDFAAPSHAASDTLPPIVLPCTVGGFPPGPFLPKRGVSWTPSVQVRPKPETTRLQGDRP